MALKLVNQAGNALGQFDGYDTQVPTFLGGEVVTFASLALTDPDKAAQDVFDGYVNLAGVQKRTYVTRTLDSDSRPLMLADDGIAGYGTLFGSVVGGTVGKVTSGAVLGPHTATASGKITCWHLPGVYAVSLDACDTDAATGLQPTNTTLEAGAPLTYTSTGLLTPFNGGSGVGGPVVGTLIDFETNGSLVTTPNYLVSALNVPFGFTPGPRQFAYAVFYFNPPVA